MSSLQKFHRRTNAKSNTLHTGTVSISGTAAVGSVLTASNNIADTDGLGTFAYQWKRSGSAISGATGTTYTLVSVDSGNTMTVTITYTDGKGFIETETSAATATVITPIVIGSGDDTKGYWLGNAGDGTSKLIVAPKTTEASLAWGSFGINRSAFSSSDGLANTNTLYAFGNSITTGHPAAYYCKTLTQGGYNTWYLPAPDELNTLFSNKSATPFATANSFGGSNYWSSMAQSHTGNYWAWFQDLSSGTQTYGGRAHSYYVRAVRRSAI